MSKLLWLFLCSAAALCWADHEEWNWPCSPVTHLETADVDKFVGNWYYVKHMSNGNASNLVCSTIDISRNGSSDLAVNVHHECSCGKVTNLNLTFHLASSTQWIGAYPAVVIDQSEDDNTLTLSGCLATIDNPGSRLVNTVILSKTRTPDLGPLLVRLQNLGIPGAEKATVENSPGCPAAQA